MKVKVRGFISCFQGPIPDFLTPHEYSRSSEFNVQRGIVVLWNGNGLVNGA